MSTQAIQGSRCSPQQIRLWQLPGGELAYRSQCAVLVTGKLDRDLLRKATVRVVRRHEILRSTFRKRPGMKIPLLIPSGAEPSWQVIELPGLSPTEEHQRLRELFRQDRSTAVGLEEGPLLRWVLLALAPERHLLYFNLPSLCADAESLETIVREIGASYSGGGDLPEEPLQYADYAEWSTQMLDEEDEEATHGMAFWNRFDLSSLQTLRLPAEDARQSAIFRPEALSIRFDEELTRRALAAAGATGGSLADWFFACWQVLVWKLTSRSQPIIGRLSSGRSYEDLEGAVGLYARYLPIVGRLRGGLRFTELVTQGVESMEAAVEWEDYAVWDQGDDGEAMSLPVVFDDGEDTAEQASSGVSFSILEQDVCFERFKWQLSVVAREPEAQLLLGYDANLFEAADMALLKERLRRVVEQVVADPEKRIGEIDVLAPADRERLVVAFNATAMPRSPAGTILDGFTKTVARVPDRTAVVYEDQALSYAGLEARSHQLARHLRRLGVSADRRVMICLERSIGVVVSMLGVLKAGGAYVPLEPTLPEQRLRSMLETADPCVIVTQKKHLSVFHSVDVPTVSLDSDWDEITRDGDEIPATTALAASLAYVIFTSGSTGQPKGVAVEHRQLHNYVRSIRHRLAATDGASFATVSTFAADLGNTVIFPALTTGGSLHVVSHALATDPEALADYFSRHPIDVLKIVPSHLEALLLAVAPEQVLPRRVLVLGGESLSWQLASQLLAVRSAPKILNHYGPTETTVGILTHRLDPAATGSGSPSVPVGGPLGNSQAYLSDQGLSSVTTDVVGEILLGGDNVTRGYLGAPAPTAERFLPDPWGSRPGGRLYRTGDLGRFLPQAVIEFAGRRDHQVKLRGFRIELGEIEHTLGEHPAVSEAVVVVRQDRPGHQRLVAYAVSRPGARLNPSELRDFAGQRLPEYMVPAAFVVLERLPLNANGKIDRQALPAPDETRQARAETYAAPRTAVEELLAIAWQEVLGVEQVGIHDNFFGLGGDSILVIQVVARANRQDVRLNPRQFFQYQTVAELATVAEMGPGVQVEQGLASGDVLLTPIQHWFFERSFPDPQHWNQAVLLEVHEAPDAQQLGAVLLHLLKHHDALRLRFEKQDDGWRQFYAAPPEEAPLEWLDLSGLSAAEQKCRIEAKADDTQRSLDLTTGPLFRGVYFALGDGGADRLLLVSHHLLVDGVSWRILLEDLAVACQQLSADETIELSPKTTSFQRWAERLTGYAGTISEREIGWWCPEARDLDRPLPRDFQDGGNPTASREQVTVSLDPEKTRQLLQDAPAAYRTQINDLLLTALVQAFGSWTGQPSLWLDLEGHGREDLFEDVDLSRTVGWFTTHYPIFLELAETNDLGGCLKSVKEQLRQVPAGGIGYGVLRYLSPDKHGTSRLRSLSRPEVGFNYLGQSGGVLNRESAFRPASESHGSTSSPQAERRCVIEIVAIVAGGRLETAWRYSRDLYRRETVERLANNFHNSLKALIAHCTSADSGGLTPSDFALAELDQTQLDKIVAKVGLASSRKSS